MRLYCTEDIGIIVIIYGKCTLTNQTNIFKDNWTPFFVEMLILLVEITKNYLCKQFDK